MTRPLKDSKAIAKKLVGKPVESLTLSDRWACTGAWVALELYTPQNMSLRTIEAAGQTVQDCIQQLADRGLTASHFEFVPLPPPYETQ